MPLAAYLKNYFSQHKKHGSTDRKQIAHWCFCYYRIGKALINFDSNKRLKISFYLCNHSVGKYDSLYTEEWLKNWHEDVNKRIEFIQRNFSEFNIEEIFNFKEDIAKTIDITEFASSHLLQPDLFIRIRPQQHKQVLSKLEANNIACKIINDDCISFANNTKLEAALNINKEVVIQDFSSQQIAYFLNYIRQNIKHPISIWDCCAASGGKSILAYDILQNIKLTVSDIRPSIITNLRKRFQEAGIKNYESDIIDSSIPIKGVGSFDFIICDAPCTGSGTWGRTPENLFFFDQNKIDDYQNLQIKICNNTVHHLKKDGYFLYITCSVFTKENDDVVNYFQQHHHLQLIQQKYFIGYTTHADTMFGALLRKI